MKIVSDALKEDRYVEVNVASIFTAQATTGEAIPDETTYVWHMVSAANGVQFESTDNVFSYKFPRYGHYDLSVIGNHSAGVFADQIRIDAESKSKFSHFLSLSLPPSISNLTIIPPSLTNTCARFHKQSFCLIHPHHSCWRSVSYGCTPYPAQQQQPLRGNSLLPSHWRK